MTRNEVTAGVDALVDRLHRDGVEAGRQEAQRLIDTAHAQAEALLQAARAERDGLLAAVEAEVQALRHAGEAALRLALRDTLLNLRKALAILLVDRLGARVRGELAKPELMAELTLWAARRMTGQAGLSVRLGGDGDMSATLAAVADLLSRDLVEASPVLEIGGVRPGVTLRREGDSMAIELSDETLSAFLFTQLQPRFREIFEGVGVD